MQPLQAALEAAAARAQQLVDATKQAKDALASLGDQLQDDLDSAAGNDTAVEDRRYQKQLADLKAAAQAAGDLSSAQYTKDVQNANDLHALKLKQIQQQQAAQNGGNGSGSSSRSTSTPSGGIGSGNGGASSGGGSGFGSQPITVQIVAPQGVIIMSQSQLDELGNKVIIPALRNVQKRSTTNIITGGKL